jgi:hypothetical protein
MTKKMEEFFNLPPAEELEAEEEPPIKTREQLMVEAKEIYTSLTTAEKVDYALPTVVGLDMHDSEMDTIAFKAVKTFEDLIALGGNVPDIHAGKIYEVAGQMLKTALEAKNAKAEKKLRMIELQLKKVRAEQIDIDQGNGNRKLSGGGEFDRNELLKYIVSNKSENSDK